LSILGFLISAHCFSIFSLPLLAYKSLPTLEHEIFTSSGERGWVGSWHSHVDGDGLIPHDEVLKTQLIDVTRMFIDLSTPQGITKHWTLNLRGYLKPRPYDCTFEFGLAVGGRAKVHKYSYYIYIEPWTTYSYF
jgi:beta-glucosidase